MIKSIETESSVQRIKEVPKIPKSFYIPDVPDALWPQAGWCGYTSTAMLLQYWWGEQYTDTMVYDKFQSEIKRGKYEPQYYPNAQKLAQISKELIVPEPKTIALAGEYYEKNDINPHDMLKRFISQSIPCIIRIPGHFMVAVGYDENSYTFHNPSSVTKPVWNKDNFDDSWGTHDTKYPTDSSYLILAIYPQKRAEILKRHEENLKKLAA